mgnify:FL=1
MTTPSPSKPLFLPLLLLLWLLPAATAGQELEPETPETLCATRCGQLPCEFTNFKGFSPDGKLAGYITVTCPPPQSHSTARLVWYVKFLPRSVVGRIHSRNKRLEGVRFPDYFQDNRFVTTELFGQHSEKGKWQFIDSSNRTFEITLLTLEKVTWTLTVRHGTKVLLTYSSNFDEIYFDFRPRIYESPDGRKVAVTLDLDAMVRRDSGVAFFNLPPVKAPTEAPP